MWLEGFLGKKVSDFVLNQVAARWKSRTAKRELARIAAMSAETAVRRLPALAEDLRSKTFIDGAIMPVLQKVAANPSHLPDAEDAATRFIETFIAGFAKSEPLESAMTRIFRTERSDLKPAFEAMFMTMLSELIGSKHWREVGHYFSQEKTREDVAIIRKAIEESAIMRGGKPLDDKAARNDARAGSTELRAWPKDIYGQRIPRRELTKLRDRIRVNSDSTLLLLGEPGSGKSALLSSLTENLEADGAVVFAIKADKLPAEVKTIDDIGQALGMTGRLEEEIAQLAVNSKVALIIDQLDAVSEVMDRKSSRMTLLLQLVRVIRDSELPVAIVVSSRPFEARHDARFQQLDAEEISLSLPSFEDVKELLQALEINVEAVDEAFHETLRRPFALKLFVDLVRRGTDPETIHPGQLLDRWLETADLGDDSEQREALELMERLALDMVETETLWRPADHYVMKGKAALARCEACGLIVRSGDRIGFSHQSWLDDFQAKSFRKGQELAEYVWATQDSLFMRATLLRALQRLRVTDEKAYMDALNLLLGEAKTRRHVKHLTVDILSSVAEPLAAEAAWIETLIERDWPLASRALGNIAPRWEAWREKLPTTIETLMLPEQSRFRATQLLSAEAQIDLDSSLGLMSRHWSDAAFDERVFQVIENSGAFTPETEKLAERILNRTTIDQFTISSFAKVLCADGKAAQAARMIVIWLSSIQPKQDRVPSVFGVMEMVEAHPLEFSRELAPWFIKRATADVQDDDESIKRFPKSNSLPWDWDHDPEQDSLYEATQHALKLTAQIAPDDAKPLVEQLAAVSVDEVQDMAARALAAGGEALAHMGYEFLLRDGRRFEIGDAHVMYEVGLSGSESGLSSQELVAAIAPHLSGEHLSALRDAIEAFEKYDIKITKDLDAAAKRMRMAWAEEARLVLLEQLPPRILSASRRRQIAEWRKTTRRPLRRSSGRDMATFVGSPMSSEAMAKASDNALINMLNELDDHSPRRPRARPISQDGGVIELARAFAAFGKANPERAMRLAEERLAPGRHEHAAGELVHELSKLEGIDGPRLVTLIHELTDKGFSSGDWKRSAAWALQSLADQMDGLSDETVAMLQSWLVTDEAAIDDQIERRIELETHNASRNSKNERLNAEPKLFGMYGGFRIVPQDNFTQLSAIAAGLLDRKDRAFDAWLSILEKHAEGPEDPDVWVNVLLHYGRWLYWADRPRVQAMLARLWQRDARIFNDIHLVLEFWRRRAMFPDDLLIAQMEQWFASDDEAKRQAAAEYVQAGLLDTPNSPVFLRLQHHLTADQSEILTGQLFTAAAAWRENTVSFRSGAHAVLMRHVRSAEGDQAHAISTAVDRTRKLAPDFMTRELILAIADNPAVLAKSLNMRFADGLQSLLLYPGFDEPVMTVTEKIIELMIGDTSVGHGGLASEDFVQVCVALQRSDGEIRKRAMDAYEKLLDLGAYGAEAAAKAALKSRRCISANIFPQSFAPILLETPFICMAKLITDLGGKGAFRLDGRSSICSSRQYASSFK